MARYATIQFSNTFAAVFAPRNRCGARAGTRKKEKKKKSYLAHVGQAANLELFRFSQNHLPGKALNTQARRERRGDEGQASDGDPRQSRNDDDETDAERRVQFEPRRHTSFSINTKYLEKAIR